MAIAAFHTMNDPVAQGDVIAEAVSRGHLVRIRADANPAEADPPDYTRAEAALASGAQFVSTDFPYPGDETSYGVVIPGGAPSAGVPRIFLLRAARRSPARRRPWVFSLDVPQGTTAENTLRAPCDRAPLLALATKARETPALRCNSVNAPPGCTSEAIEDHPVPSWGP